MLGSPSEIQCTIPEILIDDTSRYIRRTRLKAELQRSGFTEHDNSIMRHTSLNRESRSFWPVPAGEVDNHVLPFDLSSTSKALERRRRCRFIDTNVAACDLTVNVGESIFHLHKLPLITKSGYINRLVFQRINKGETNSIHNIHIDNLPGNTQIFELVIKFCYGLPIGLKATNVAPLHCCAHFLEMTEDLEQENLISKTETFLSFLIFSSWKDTIRILKSCEALCSWPEELGIVKRCSESIAWKASTKTRVISNVNDEKYCLNYLVNGIRYSKNNQKDDGSNHTVTENWWFQDVSSLRIDHFVEVMNAIKTKGNRSELVGSCIVNWASKRLRTIEYKEVERVTVESLIKVLPMEKGSVSCNFLLQLLKVGLMVNINRELTEYLERRMALMLEGCSVSDLLVKNYGNDDSFYDVNVVFRVIRAYMKYVSSDSNSRMLSVARLVDEYLALVARDEKLSVKCFRLLAEALPENAHVSDDKLYGAIDMYLKSHPALTEEERRNICRSMDYHKLSRKARDHAMKNDRLPMNVTIQFILLEQVKMTGSILAVGSKFLRTNSQAIVRKDFFRCIKKLQVIKEEVEEIKEQLNELHVCKVELKNQIQILNV